MGKQTLYASFWVMRVCRWRCLPLCVSKHPCAPQWKAVLGDGISLQHLLAHSDGRSSDQGEEERALLLLGESSSLVLTSHSRTSEGLGRAGDSPSGAHPLEKEEVLQQFACSPLHPFPPPLAATPHALGSQGQVRHDRCLPLVPGVTALMWLCLLAGH